jgi:membrane associated rhomboid family serine protease/tetratricopeptide (TPR) repeat protein
MSTRIMEKRSWPYLTWTLTAILIAVYAGERAISVTGDGGVDPAVLSSLGASSKALAARPGEWFRPITAVFLHFDALHLASNAVGLLLIGRYLEPAIGRPWFWTVFGLSGLAGSLASMYGNTHFAFAAGASTSIAGLYACAFLWSFKRFYWRRIWVQILLGGFIALSLIPLGKDPAGMQVDNAAHYGGFAMGAALGVLLLVLWPRRETKPDRAAGMACASFVAIVYGAGFVLFASHYDGAIELYRAAAHVRNKEYKAALVAYGKSIERDPKNALLFYGRGAAFAAQGDYDKAVSDYTEAAKLMPENSTFHLALGEILSSLGDQAKAQNEADDVLRREPENIAANRLLSRALALSGQYEKAIAKLDDLIRRSRPDAETFNHRAMILTAWKKYPEALEDAKRAVAMNPGPANRDTRGQIYLALDRPKEALDDFNAVLRGGESYTITLYGRGTALEKLGFPKLAIIDYEAALKSRPQDEEDRQAQENARKRLEALAARN